MDEFGNILNQKGTDFVVTPLCKDGYKRFRNKYVHRLVYEAYVGDIPEGMTVDHIDGDKLNNHHSNLQLLSPEDNAIKGNAKTWYVVSPDGEEYQVVNMEQFCKDMGLHAAHMRQVAAGKPNYKSYKGWRKL